MSRIPRALVVGATSIVAAWLLCWQLVVGALWWAGAAWLATRPRRGWLVGAWMMLGLPAALWSLVRYGQRVDALSAAVFSAGPSALGLADLFALWGLNLLMAAAGLVLGFPEVAAETALLAAPMPASVEVPAPGGFPACVPKVQQAVRRAEARGRPQRVSWSYTSVDSVRGALALNPATVHVRPIAQAGQAGREVRVTVPVDYPPRFRLRLGELGPVDLSVEEGLFHALEERGWLHPYQLTYRWTEAADAPPAAPCEAWSVSLLSRR